MNLIVLSEMSIYKELESHCKIEKISIKKEIAVHTLPLEYNVEKVQSFLKKEINIIFQSKNAIDYSTKVHAQIKKIETGIIYCMGKYSAQKAKETFLIQPKYPKYNYSSEQMLNMILKDLKTGSKVLIIKGKGGRTYLEEEIKKGGFEIKAINVYQRKLMPLKLLENKMIKSINNFFIVSSKVALVNLIKYLEILESDYKSIVIVPNIRLLENVSMNKINDHIIINNSAEPLEYINAIREHNER